jgi:hypothetical protein
MEAKESAPDHADSEAPRAKAAVESRLSVFAYGARTPTGATASLVEQELRRAHRYRNALVEIERRRRARIAEAQRAHDALGPLLAAIESTETTVAEARREAKASRTGRGDPDKLAALREIIEVAQADLSVLRWLRGWAKAAARSDAALLASYREIEEQSSAEIKALRGSDEAPYWGTYLAIETAARKWKRSADAPRFIRYDGTGRIIVQLQGGLRVEEAMNGEDTRLRILPPVANAPVESPQTPRQIARAVAYGIVHFCRCGNMTREFVGGRGQGRAAPLHLVALRIGSEGRNKRTPVWATIPTLLDRPLPPDGVIKWAWAIRKRVGMRFVWEVQFVLEADSLRPPARADSSRTIALDIGSRELPTGQTRVAYWVDSNGARGEIVTAAVRRYDVLKELLALYRTMPWAPDWLQEQTSRVAFWRSPARAAILYRDWQHHEHDEVIRTALGNYLTHDRHLLDWESKERRRHLARRRERYRVHAAEIARTYGIIVLADRDYSRQEVDPEKGKASEGRTGRILMRQAAPGELRREILRAAQSYGSHVIEISIEGDTARAIDPKVCERMLANAAVAMRGSPPLVGENAKPAAGGAAAPQRRRLGRVRREDALAHRDVTVVRE